MLPGVAKVGFDLVQGSSEDDYFFDSAKATKHRVATLEVHTV